MDDLNRGDVVNDDVIRKIHANLREFGYGDVTLDYVREQVEALKEDNRPKNIIAMFAKGMLVENGYMEE